MPPNSLTLNKEQDI
jgi:hypothetical protein